MCFYTTWQNGDNENNIFHSNAVLVDSVAVVGLCYMHNAPVRSLPKRKIVICDVFHSIYIC